MAGRKKADNNLTTKDSSNESWLDKFDREITKYENEQKKWVRRFDFFDKHFVNPFLDMKKKQQEEKYEKAKKKLAESIKEKNEAIAARLNSLNSIHKFHSTFSVKEYMEQEKKRIQAFGTDIVYKSIVEGGDWFQRYCAYNVYVNRKKAFDNCGLFYRVSYSLHSVSDKHKNVVVRFPPFKDFNVLKQLNYDNEMTQITEDYLEDKEKEEYYADFMYSVLLQTIAIVFDCVDNVHDLTGQYLLDTLTATGERGFFDDSYGKDFIYPVISVTVPRIEYQKIKITLSRVNPESLFQRLGAEMYTDLFYTDDYEPDKIDKAEKLKAKRQAKKDVSQRDSGL